jgi:predicted acylesterase/phospholipase RssA
MLEFCLPGGGLMGVTLAGAMVALRERGVVPQVVTGISSGAQAAYAALAEEYIFDTVRWFKRAKSLFMTKPLRRFIPPYDIVGEEALSIASGYGSDPSYLKTLGVKHFYVGYTELPRLRFVAEDILTCGSRVDAYRAILKSSTIPFLTHFAPHCAGAIDGGFRKMAFSSPCRDTRERWLLTYRTSKGQPRFRGGERFDRVLDFACLLRNPFYATDAQLDTCFAMGYDQGMAVAL